MTSVFLVGCNLSLHASPPATSEDVSDLMELLIDELDRLGAVPSVSATGVGVTVEFRIEVEMDVPDAMTAHFEGEALIYKALMGAGFLVDGPLRPTGISSSTVDELQVA